MELESIGIAAGLALALYPVLAVACRTRARALWIAAAVFVCGLPLATFARQWYGAPSAIDPAVLPRPVVVPQDDYVTSTTCRSCHPNQYGSWAASYHHTMTREAVRGAVAGDFDGVTLHAGDWTWRLDRRGDEFWIRTEPPAGEPDAEPLEQPVVMTTGSHHYQVYWLPDEKRGVLRAFPFVYLLDEHEWIPRQAAFLSPPEAPRHQEPARWNNGCAKCHSLNAKWRPVRPRTDTEVSELGISCEACHGPAAEHVRRNRDPTRRYRQHLVQRASDSASDTGVVEPSRLDSRRASEVCGQCHAIAQFVDREDFHEWANHGYRYRPGDVLAETRDIVRGVPAANTGAMQAHLAKKPGFMEDSFWTDGAVRVAGREYNGLLESPCFQRGELSCLSCHALHQPEDDPRPVAEWADDQLKPGMRGDLACTQCHDQFAGEALTAHTRHARDSSGSRCMNCHMPYTTYGLLKAIRSHTVDSPRVWTAATSTRPNACNQCHLDRTLAWAAEELESGWGVPQPILTEDERTIAASVLWLLRGHAGQRALAAWTMGWQPAREISGGDWMAPYLAQLLVDPYDAVRFVAHRSLRQQPGFADFEYDSLADGPERARTSQRAFAQWRAAWSGENRTTGPALLYDREGQLDRKEIARLIGVRDDRPVVFRE